jgi:hypothetical protein
MGKGAKQVKAQSAPAPTPIQSPYAGIQNYSVNLDGLSNSVTGKNDGNLNSFSFLAPGLKQAQDTATTGLNSGLSYLSRSPQSRLQDLASGNNDYYNLSRILANKDYATNIADTNQNLSSRGLQDSTTAGAYLGTLANTQLERDLQNKIASLDYLDQKASNDVNINSGVIGQMANIQALPLQQTIQEHQVGYGSIDQNNQFNANLAQQNAQFNAQQAQQAAQINAQIQQQRAQSLSGLGGNLVGGALSLASIPLAGATNLASLSRLMQPQGQGYQPSGLLGQSLAGSFLPKIIGRAY